MGSGQPPPSGGAQGMMGGQFAPAFGGFMNDQTAQMGLQVGQKAFQAGQEVMEQSVRSLYDLSPCLEPFRPVYSTVS